MTLIPRQATIATLVGELDAIAALLDGLSEAGWRLPTPLPGWDVKAVLAHIIGTETMIAGEASPEITDAVREKDHVQNDIGAFNEAWIEALAPIPGTEALERLRALTARRAAMLDGLSQEEWDAEGSTPVGRASYGRFMRIRVFDLWIHEQDLRDALGRPGHTAGPAVELALDEMAVSMGFVVGKRAGAPPGCSVRFALQGAPNRAIDVEVAEKARVVETLAGEPTVTLTMPVGTFVRLGGGRITAADAAKDVTVRGDAQLGQAVLDNLAYTM